MFCIYTIGPSVFGTKRCKTAIFLWYLASLKNCAQSRGCSIFVALGAKIFREVFRNGAPAELFRRSHAGHSIEATRSASYARAPPYPLLPPPDPLLPLLLPRVKPPSSSALSYPPLPHPFPL